MMLLEESTEKSRDLLSKNLVTFCGVCSMSPPTQESSIILIISISFISISKQRWVIWKQFEAPSIEIDREPAMA